MKSEEPSPQALDKIDARLLQVLQAGGRISNLKLAEAAHLPPTAVLERAKRLTRVANMQAYREFVGSVIWRCRALPGVAGRARDAHLRGDGRDEEHDDAGDLRGHAVVVANDTHARPPRS